MKADESVPMLDRTGLPGPADEAEPPVRRPRPAPRALAERLALPAVWLVVVVVFGIMRPSEFLTSANLSTIFGSQTALLVLTLGLLIPLTAGDYDLSVAYNLALSAMVVALLNVNDHWAILPAIMVAILAGTTLGAINGGLVVLFGIDPFIVTLGTGTFVQGVIYWISNSNTISGISSSLVNWVSVKTLLGIPLEFYYGLVLAAVVWYVFEYTPIGRRLLIVGRGREVARLSGMHVARIRWGALVASGFISAVAGVIYAGTTGAADPTSGTELLLPAFAAAFLGATTIMPGRFNPWGATVAVYFLVTGITGLQILGVQSFVQQLFYGGALVIAVALSQIARRRQALDTR